MANGSQAKGTAVRRASDARAAATVTTEFVTWRWPTTDTGIARALYIGGRINTRAIESEFSDQADAAGNVFIFRYGAVVLFGVEPEAEVALLARIRPHVIDPVDAPVVEESPITVDPTADEAVDAQGRISLKDASPERLTLVATMMARSVVLEHDELRIAAVLDQIEPLIGDLQRRGRVGLGISAVMRQVGDVLAAYHRMVGRVQVTDKPDILWDNGHLERLYTRLDAEFEIDERSRSIDEKLEVVGDTADTLLDIVQHSRGVRLELAIIALILFEVLMSLYDRFMSPL